jgi:hypothetical protein
MASKYRVVGLIILKKSKFKANKPDLFETKTQRLGYDAVPSPVNFSILKIAVI